MIVDLRGREDLNPDTLLKEGFSIYTNGIDNGWQIRYHKPNDLVVGAFPKDGIITFYSFVEWIENIGITDGSYQTYIEAINAIKNNLLKIEIENNCDNSCACKK